MTRPSHSFRLLGAMLRVTVAEEVQYRAEFAASFATTLLWAASAFVSVALFFRHTTRLGGWSVWEVTVLVGVFMALSGVVEGVLRPGIGTLADEVRRGTLDLLLARPVDAQLYLSFRKLNLWRATDVALGFAIAAHGLSRLGRAELPSRLALFSLTFAAGATILYSLWVALMCLAFRIVAVENLTTVFDALFESARYPVSAYPGALRLVFVYLLPLAWTTTIPAEALTGRLHFGGALAAVAAATLALVASRLLWLDALRHYASAGG